MIFEAERVMKLVDSNGDVGETTGDSSVKMKLQGGHQFVLRFVSGVLFICSVLFKWRKGMLDSFTLWVSWMKRPAGSWSIAIWQYFARRGLMLEECPHGPRGTRHSIIHIMIYVRSHDFVMVEYSFFGTCLLEHRYDLFSYDFFCIMRALLWFFAWARTPPLLKMDWLNCKQHRIEEVALQNGIKMSNPPTCFSHVSFL